MIAPYGGTLVDLVVSDPAEQAELRRRGAGATAIELSHRSLCDFELLATGGFSPLQTFMAEADYWAVLRDLRLSDGQLYPIPITLPLPDGARGRRGDMLALKDWHGELLALMTIDDVFRWDRAAEARQVCGTTDERHPLVAEMAGWPARYVSGPLKVLRLPHHHSFRELRRTPLQVRAALAALGGDNVVAFQTRNPMHRVHEELTKRAVSEIDGALLIHPVVGQTRPGDVDARTRVRCYTELVRRYYDPSRTVLSLLPLAMRMAGPREALWHAIIRRNYGANHLIIGRDHAGPGRNAAGRPFYGAYDAQDLVRRYEPETGVAALTFEELVYVPLENRYVERSRLNGRRFVAISGTEVREQYLARAKPLPAWFTRPEVAAILREAVAAQTRQGFCVWLMGLSGAGKSTIAAKLAARLRHRRRHVTILDGDTVRTEVSADLGFTREDRDTNVLRIGTMAADIVWSGGVVICAVIAPYAVARNRVRALIGKQFVLVYVDTPLEVCEQRDVKGLYARARRGEIGSLTGVDDPFEVPLDAEIRLDASDCGADHCVTVIMAHLLENGVLQEVEPALQDGATETAGSAPRSAAHSCSATSGTAPCGRSVGRQPD